MLSFSDYTNRLYASFLGMNAGIRLGVPLEPNPWTYETIRQVFGDIKGYLSHFHRFAADDDANGPVYFIRPLLEKLRKDPSSPALTPQEMGDAWLEYTREGKGMFWWGGVGVSTEHTAYHNLKKGIPAPKSGSKESNGPVLAEQIGGQIFADTWGMICPGNPALAASYAAAASSVSHDGEGLHGAAFMAAAIASAFTAASINDILKAGLSQIPSDCLYYRAVESVRRFHRENPDDWHLCMEYLLREWGYDRFPGECHIIPNAAVCALALCYGEGDFARTIEIAVMCGWDTDCNGGNVGSILGAFVGLEGIPMSYRAPIQDTLVCSGISGYLNQIDIPSFVQSLAYGGCLLNNIPVPEPPLSWTHPGEIHYDFTLPGSTHGLLLSEETCTFLHHSRWEGTPCLEIDVERVFNGQGPCRLYHPMFYRRRDFDDERYDPVFSPMVYPGQTFSFTIRESSLDGAPTRVIPYLTTAMDVSLPLGDRRLDLDPENYPGILTGSSFLLSSKEWTTVTWELPDLGGDYVYELGFLILTPPGACTRLFLKDYSVTGDGCFSLSPTKMVSEFGQMLPFSLHHCQVDPKPSTGSFVLSSDENGVAFTGNYYSTKVACQGFLSWQGSGEGGISLRGKGVKTYYAAGLDAEGYGILKKCSPHGETLLARTSQPYPKDQWISLTVTDEGDRILCCFEDKEVLQADAPMDPSGMVGFYLGSKSHLSVKDFRVSHFSTGKYQGAVKEGTIVS